MTNSNTAVFLAGDNGRPSHQLFDRVVHDIRDNCKQQMFCKCFHHTLPQQNWSATTEDTEQTQ